MQITPRILAMALKVGPRSPFASFWRPSHAPAAVPKFKPVPPTSDAITNTFPEELWH
jgi:hypothetical protein